MKISTVRAITVLAVSAVFVGIAASPAVAITTPTPGALASGSSLYAVDCDSTPGQVYAIDVSNADATPVGSGSNVQGSMCAGGGAWDYATSTMYYIAWNGNSYLATVNLTTGVSTAVGETDLSGTATSIIAIAIGVNGTAYAIDQSGELYSLNLSTGALTAIAATGSSWLYGFAADPTTGVFYVLNFTTGVYSSINTTTAALTTAGTLSLNPNNLPEALQIDTNGTFWVENDGVDADIWSFDPTDPSAAVESGTLTVAGTQTYTESLLLYPNSAPTITSPAPAASIPVSAAFSYTVTATGTGPITFSITAGALPPGLTLNATTGVISGTPTTTGSYSYTVTATNTAGTASLAITQTVAAAIHLPIVSG